MEDNTNLENSITKRKKAPIWIIIAIVIALTGLTIGGVVIAQSNTARKVSKQLELARKYVSELNYDQAIIAYQALIEIDPKNVDAYLELANIFVEVGDNEKAKEMLDQAVKVADGDQKAIVKQKVDEVTAKIEERNGDKGNDVALVSPSPTEMPTFEPTEELTAAPTEALTQEPTQGRTELINGTDGSYWIYEYDASEKLEKVTGYNADGTLIHIMEYDNEGNYKLYYYMNDGTYVISERDSAGKIVQDTEYYLDGRTRITEYFDDQLYHPSHERCYDTEGRLCQEFYTEYDLHGNRKTTTDIIYNDDGSIFWNQKFEYDESGKAIRRTDYEDGNVKSIYEYDSEGQIEKITYFYEDGSSSVEEWINGQPPY